MKFARQIWWSSVEFYFILFFSPPCIFYLPQSTKASGALTPASQETVTAASAEADGKVCLDFSYKHCMHISVVVHRRQYGKQFVFSVLSLTQYALQSIVYLALLILVCAVAGKDVPLGGKVTAFCLNSWLLYIAVQVCSIICLKLQSVDCLVQQYCNQKCSAWLLNCMFFNVLTVKEGGQKIS